MQAGDEVDDKLDETLILDVHAGGGKVCAAILFYYVIFYLSEMLVLNWNNI